MDIPALDIDRVLFAGRKMPAHCKVERRAVAALCSRLAAGGFEVVGVWDGELFTRTPDARAVMEIVFNLDEASVRVCKAGATHGDIPEECNYWGGDDADAPDVHGIYLVLGNGVDLIADWNYSADDADGFNALMDSFIDNMERFE
jgi:hypothetical protein